MMIRVSVHLCVMVIFLMLTMNSALASEEKERLITLTQAISLALEHNPELKQAVSQTRYSAVGVEKSRDGFLPGVSAASSFFEKSAKSRDGFLSGGSAASSFPESSAKGSSLSRQEYESLSASLDSRLNLFNGFADRAALEESRQTFQSDVKTEKRKEQTIVFNTVSAYLDAVLKQERIAVTEQNLAEQILLLEQIRAFVTAGRRPATDLYQQQAETEDSRFNLLDGQKQLNVSKMKLMQTMGISVSWFVVKVPASDLFPTQFPTDQAKPPFFDKSRGLRADLLAQEHKIVAADEKIIQAKAGMRPTVELFMETGSAYSGTDDASVMGQMEDFSASMGVSVAIPIFDRNLTRHSIAQSRIAREIQMLEKERLITTIELEIGEAWENYQTTLAQASVAQARLLYASKALDSVQQRYIVGAATLTELIQARATHVEARYGCLSANINQMVQAAALEYAKGVGFKND